MSELQFNEKEFVEIFQEFGPHKTELCFKSHYCIYYPEELNENQDIYKTIIWANGSFTVPYIYHNLLKHLASWGYVVIASWSPMPFIDQALFRCGYNIARKLNESDNLFNGRLDVENMGASGHSQGGGVSLLLSRNENFKATVAIQPYPLSSKKTKHSLLLITGSRDIFVWPWLINLISFKTSKKLCYWLNHRLSTHLSPMFTAKDLRAPITAFFQWHLSDNMKARACFNDNQILATDRNNWQLERRND